MFNFKKHGMKKNNVTTAVALLQDVATILKKLIFSLPVIRERKFLLVQ